MSTGRWIDYIDEEEIESSFASLPDLALVEALNRYPSTMPTKERPSLLNTKSASMLKSHTLPSPITLKKESSRKVPVPTPVNDEYQLVEELKRERDQLNATAIKLRPSDNSPRKSSQSPLNPS